MKIQLSIPAFILALGLSWATAMAADTPKTGVEAKPTETAGHLSRREIIKKLQLTADQNKRLIQQRAAFRQAMAELDGQLKVKRVELENELDKPTPDKAKLDLLSQEIGELYGKKLAEKVKAKIEFETNILTPQQVDLLKTLQGKDGADEGF